MEDPGVLYILNYRHGLNPNCIKYFRFSGSVKDAMRRGVKHCEVMGYSNPFVRPFLSNLENDEIYHLERIQETVGKV